MRHEGLHTEPLVVSEEKPVTREEALALPPGAIVTWLDDRTRGRRFGRLVRVGYKNAYVEFGGGDYLPVESKKLSIAEITAYKNPAVKGEKQ